MRVMTELLLVSVQEAQIELVTCGGHTVGVSDFCVPAAGFFYFVYDPVHIAHCVGTDVQHLVQVVAHG